jgi:flagellar export protein FliJ
MAYRFPLTTVLRFRRSMEKREELALQKVLVEIAQSMRKIEQLNARIAEAQRTREETLRQSISAFQLQSMLSEVQIAAERKRSLIDSLASLEQKRITQMTAYQAALQDRQTLSKLEDRRREEHKVELERSQQKQIDDIFAARAHRK